MFDFMETSSQDAAEDFMIVPAPLTAPTQIGPFGQISNELNGKFGGIHRIIKEKVSIDIIGKISNQERENLIRSVNTANWFKVHPNVLRILWVTQSIPLQTLYIFTEHSGDTLQSIIHRSGPMSELEVKPIAYQIATAVRFFHNNNVLHQSLTLDNIYLKPSTGEIKISGFDQANQLGDQYRQTALRTSLPYCPPELITNLDITKLEKTKSDIWGIGSVIYGLIVGTLPFERECHSHTRTAILNVDPQFPQSLSDSCRRLLTTMLQKDPAKRPSCEQIRKCVWLRGVDVLVPENIQVDPEEVDDVMRAMEMSESTILSSHDESVYNIDSAERYLVLKTIQRAKSGSIDDEDIKRQQQQQQYESDEVPSLPLYNPIIPSSGARVFSAAPTCVECRRASIDSSEDSLADLNYQNLDGCYDTTVNTDELYPTTNARKTMFEHPTVPSRSPSDETTAAESSSSSSSSSRCTTPSNDPSVYRRKRKSEEDIHAPSKRFFQPTQV